MVFLKLLKYIFLKKRACSECRVYGIMADNKWRYFKCKKCKGTGEKYYYKL